MNNKRAKDVAGNGLKYNVLSIKKRHWIMRFFSIDDWKVRVEINEEIYTFNCWASSMFADIWKQSLLGSLEDKIKQEVLGLESRKDRRERERKEDLTKETFEIGETDSL